nr:MAG: head fiber protein [Bacteriophage sp.]
MAKTGKGLPRSLKNVDFGDLDISVGWGEVTGKPAVIAAGATQEAARTAIGAGTSNLAIGTTSTTAMAGDKFVRGAAVTDVGTQAVTGEDATTVAASAQTAVNAVGAQLNALLAQLRAAKIIAS